MELYDRIIHSDLLVRRITIAAMRVIPESKAPEEAPRQLSLFDDPEQEQARIDRENAALAKEKALQKTIVGLRKRFGKNAVLKAMNLEEDATAVERNSQVGGHKA